MHPYAHQISKQLEYETLIESVYLQTNENIGYGIFDCVSFQPNSGALAMVSMQGYD